MKEIVSTKQKILNCLKKDQAHEITIDHIMIHFTISETAVRKHLQELIKNGFVKGRTVRQDIGRPYYVYSLTTKGHNTFPNQRDELPLQLLRDLEEVGGTEVVNKLLLKRKEREKREIKEAVSDKEFTHKIEELIKIQNDKGYMIEYKEDDTGNYQLINYNCPIYNIASSYEQICDNEHTMLTDIFPQSDVISNACIVSGGKYCGWYVSKPSKTKKHTGS